MGRIKGVDTLESYFIQNAKQGESFYTQLADKNLTAMASYHGRKIKTERLIIVSTAKAEPKASRITKITIL